MPRVTVIIPTYNWSTVLPYSIGSVLDQTFTDFELLVIGDGCTDDSEAVVRAIDDPRVRWINIARTGHQSGPNNEGLRQARGESIAYLGHDDLWLPHHLATLVAALDAGADLAHSLVALIPPRGRIQVAPRAWRPPTSVMHRRGITDRIGGWRDYRELTVTPDGELWNRIEQAGCRIAFVERLTAIKFPAAWRTNVYRRRPCHEQAAWLARIRSEPDLEMLKWTAVEPSFIDRLLRLIAHPSQWLSVLWRRPGARLEAWQRVKGVEDAARSPERPAGRHE
ncbi:MAG TPA: glycosyltransferase family A protein [Thermoanaerobaculia bacterium]|nr:glycosyltransferase family A protein [Thermoanaerobaculia bacterium]